MRQKLILPLILIPATLIGQSVQLSEAARKLLSNPRSGNAQLTWSDGRKEDGRIVWVTDQFVTFVTNTTPSGCENVDLAKIAAVLWGPNSGSNPLSNFGGDVLLGAVLSPLFVGHAVANPFRRMSPPLAPLRGQWELIRPLPGVVRSSLVFEGSSVRRSEVSIIQGRYYVERNQLHMMSGGALETVIPFHFNCRELILDGPAGKFALITAPHHVTEPIVGDWHGSHSQLNFQPNGRFEERKVDVRSGVFEMHGSSVRIHWADDQEPGGQGWNAQVKHHHLVVRVGGITRQYRYIPPGIDLDL